MATTEKSGGQNVVVEFPLTSEERARRLQVEVERLARQSPTEWLFWLDNVAKKHGIEPGKLKTMIEATVKANEKKARADKAEERQREQRAEKQRTNERREQDRQQREERRAQQEADKEAEREQREREKELAEIAKLPSAVHEQKLAALAERLDEDLDFLRQELSTLIAEEEITSVACEQWPEPVDLNVLLTEIMVQIRRYVIVHNEAAAVAVVLWIGLAWVHDIARHSPILRIVSGDADAGKTTLCGVLKYLTPRAYTAAEPTGPSLYRLVDQMKPTLIVDDADNLVPRKPDLVHIINVSWTRGTKIPRQVYGSTYWFDPFCPKVFAGIGVALKPATLSRCIDIRVWPKLRDERVDDFEHTDDDTFVILRRKWARFAADNAATLKDAAPAMADFNNRIKMNWRLQFAIADLAGGKWPKAARKAAIKLTRERRESSEGKKALVKFWESFTTHGPMLTSNQVQKLFHQDDYWSDFRGRGPITKQQIAALLAPFGIYPDVIHPRGRAADRGYRVEWFELAFRHYLGKPLPPARTVVRKTRKNSRK